MRREILAHLVSFLLFFALITFVRAFGINSQTLIQSIVFFWVGGLVGTFLPDIDHLIYIYFLKPHELTSQRASSLLQQGQVLQTATLLTSTQNERQNMIFHSAWFQVIFLGMTVWVVMSSVNLFGWGVVLGFSLHLLIDQIQDYRKSGNINQWFSGIKFSLELQSQKMYLLIVFLILIFLGFIS